MLLFFCEFEVLENMKKKTKKFFLRDVPIGGDADISVQSMTKLPTSDTANVLKEIKKLKKAGCDIIRVSVLTKKDAMSLGEIVKKSPLPVVADIHFSKELAILSAMQGVDGIRINPGNIYKKSDWKKIAKIISEKGIVLRIGVNSGSIPDRGKYKNMSEIDKMVYSAIDAADFFASNGVEKIKISLKSSSVEETIKAYRKISKLVDWPLHIGVTATGTGLQSIVKSVLGIGVLLNEGIGDTIRVSLNDSSVKEVKVGRYILQALGLRKYGVEIIACPGCGRAQVDILKLAKEVEKKVSKIKKDIKIAVMGCIVNGPGEAKDADIGIAGGKKEGIVFRNGKVIKRVKESEVVDVLIKEIKNMR